MARGFPDYQGDKSGLYLKPEWAAKEGLDKNLELYEEVLAVGAQQVLQYAVPAGKVFIAISVGASSIASNLADRDIQQLGRLVYIVDGTRYIHIGFNGGGCWNFAKPVIATAGLLTELFILDC